MRSFLKKAMGFARRAENKLAEAAGFSQMNYVRLQDFSERALLLQGLALSRSSDFQKPIRTLADAEFRVFSQWGEDGIIEWLVQRLHGPESFIEFGVENFFEANCRFLLRNRNWRGLVFDGDASNIAALKQDSIFWKHDLTAHSAFITAENINDIIRNVGFAGELGLLSIDIDGNDYWVWKAIDCVNAAIVVCEYNAILGDTRPVVVPYTSSFQRFEAHKSGLYFGASILALKHLAASKGFTFVGTNSNGVNAFFVRDDLAERIISELSEIKAFASRHRDSRDDAGNLSFSGGLARFDLIAAMPVIDVTTGATISLGSMGAPYSAEWLACLK